MSARQFLEWYCYSRQVGRFGVDRDDIIHAITASSFGGGRPTDLMPYRDPFADDMTADELIGKISGALPGGDE